MAQKEQRHIFLINMLPADPEGRVKSVPLEDSDLWGLRNALRHCIQDGYAKDNVNWFVTMASRIENLRDKKETERRFKNARLRKKNAEQG